MFLIDRIRKKNFAVLLLVASFLFTNSFAMESDDGDVREGRVNIAPWLRMGFERFGFGGATLDDALAQIPPMEEDDFKRMVEGFGEGVGNLAQDAATGFRSVVGEGVVDAERELEGLREDYRSLEGDGSWDCSITRNGITYNRDNLRDLKDLIERKERDLERRKDKSDALQHRLQEFVLGTAQDVIATQQRKGKEIEIAKNQALINAQRDIEKRTLMLDWIKNNPKLIIGGIAGIIFSYYVIKHGTGVAARYIESRFGKPKIIESTSRATFWEKLRGKKKEKSRLPDVVAATELNEKLMAIVNDNLSARENGDNLSNVLLYGPPGTGKTMFAKAFALHSDLEYAVIRGSSLTSLGAKESLVELQNLFAWANQTQKGLVIFIDEIENVLRNRDSALMSEDSHKFITEFLTYVEKPSNKKVMFIFATNRLEDLDPAVVSRIGSIVKVPKPEVPELVKLIKLYSSKIQDRRVALDDCFDSQIETLARQAYGLVGRDIEEFFETRIVREFRRCEGAYLPIGVIQKALEEYIAERKDAEAILAQDSK